MTKTARITLFIISLFLLILIFFVTTGQVLPSSEHAVVLFAALLMISFVTLFLEHYFTTPTDVLASTIAILLLLSPLHSHLSRFGQWYWIFYGYNLLLLITSLIALLLLDKNTSQSSKRNRVSLVLKRFSVFFGNGRFLFCVLFILTLFFYVDSQSIQFLILAIYATMILFVDPKSFVFSSWKKERKVHNDIGEIIGVQSKNTFLAKLYAERVPVKRFDMVEFRYSMESYSQ